MSVASLDIDRSLKNRTAASKDPRIAAAAADVPNAKVTTLPPAGKSSAQKAKSAGRAKAAAKEVAKQRKATQAKVNDLAGKMTGGKKPVGGAAPRLTDEWLSAKKQDAKIKDEVKLPNGAVITIIGRWSKHLKDGGLIPMVTGRIVSGAPEGKKKGDRLNAAAAEVTHVTKK
jgi:hypothetical protein